MTALRRLRYRVTGWLDKVARRAWLPLERHPALYRVLLGLRGGGTARLDDVPPRRWTSEALKSAHQWREDRERVRRMGLPVHPDGPKNWDALSAFDLLRREADPEAPVLDAGGEVYSPLVEWLALAGFDKLLVMNLDFGRPFRRGIIRYVPGDITATGLPDGHLGAATCLSVLEHGVPVEGFLREMARVIRPEGLLALSVDYWTDPIDTAGLRAWGAPVRVFHAREIDELVASAGAHGFEPVDPPDPTTGERVVRWKAMDLEYTFLRVAFRRVIGNAS